MARTFDEAEKEVSEMYKALVQIADDIIAKSTVDITKTIKELENNIENITNADLNRYTLKLATQIYSLGDKVEHADFKRDCANVLVKETLAKEFNLASGSVAVRQNEAQINTSQETAVNLLYNLVADSMKTKLQLASKMLDSIKSVMISRNAEQKIQNQFYGSE